MNLTWRLYRDNVLIKLFRFAVMAKIAPYRLATGTHSLLATGTTGRMASLVTQTPSIAVPLVIIALVLTIDLLTLFKAFSVATPPMIFDLVNL
jgi:hypothetical protein